MAQRISRAKQSDQGGRGPVQPAAGPGERDDRLRRRAARALPDLQRGVHGHLGPGPAPRRSSPPRRSAWPGRCTRLLPDDGEVDRPARADAAHRRARGRPGPGRTAALVPLAEQDRSRWDRAAIAEGTALIAGALAAAPARPVPGPGRDRRRARRGRDRGRHRLAADRRAVRGAGPDRPQSRWSPSTGPSRWPWSTVRTRASTCWPPLDADGRLAGHHRLAAVRAHLLEQAGQPAAARDAYTEAARLTTSLPEQRYLTARAARLPDRKD